MSRKLSFTGPKAAMSGVLFPMEELYGSHILYFLAERFCFLPSHLRNTAHKPQTMFSVSMIGSLENGIHTMNDPYVQVSDISVEIS